MHKMWKVFQFLPQNGFSFRIKGKDKNERIYKKEQNKFSSNVML